MVENEIKKVARFLQIPAGKLSYTEDNIIQMTAGESRIVGFSTIINHFHNIYEKENKTSENFFLAKQYFDFANLFIRSTSKRDKCKSIPLARQHFSLITHPNFRRCMPGAERTPRIPLVSRRAEPLPG